LHTIKQTIEEYFGNDFAVHDYAIFYNTNCANNTQWTDPCTCACTLAFTSTRSTNIRRRIRRFTDFWRAGIPEQQNPSHDGGDHDDGSIETKQQPTTPIIVQITLIEYLMVAQEVSSSLIVS
jgi:hypothetical protein